MSGSISATAAGYAALAATAVAGVGSSIMSADNARRQADQQADLANQQATQLNTQAAQERQASLDQADKIRRAARSQQSTATADFAASGVSAADGSPVVVNDQIGVDSEKDAYMTILQGKYKSDSTEAQSAMARQSALNDIQTGENATTAGWMGAATSVLGAASKYGMWKAGYGGKAS
jgi:hypothetical protein